VLASCARITLIAMLGANLAHAAAPTAEQVEFFETEIRPLLDRHCYECHGDLDEPESGLRLTSRAAILAGGDSGPAAVPENIDGSLLIEAVRYRGLEMPPQAKLPAADIQKLEQWIAQGMPWPEDGTTGAAPLPSKKDFAISDEQRAFWSFQPVKNPKPPETIDAAWPQSAIDRFILAKLEANNLQPSPPAEKRVLLRRVTYDLIGLPPTPDETRDFLADQSADAFEKVVDRLLASRHYGERWGRHWLDVARYADTAGDVSDYPVPQAYKYRDYVIAAFNADKPYDEFLREQLAGDVVARDAPKERYSELVTATGFLAVTRRFGYNRHHQHHLTISDTIDTVGKSLLGLSIGCARCHDHKFDPISAADYYGLYGIFASTNYPFPGAEEQTRPQDFASLLPPEETQAAVAEHAAKLAALDKELKQLAERHAALTAEVAAAGGDAGESKTKLDAVAAEQGATQGQRNSLAASFPFPAAYGMAEGQPQEASIHLRGDPERLGAVVPRRFLEILGGAAVPADAAESGRRQLAEWIVSPENPLTARVMVNRIWHYHFGRGLVRTPSDFGVRGEAPTHPELLDYLATQFVENGWSIKKLHKQILLSGVYQMASADRPEARSVDPKNDLFWRVDPRRLDAESIRDALLAMGGALDLSRGEGHPFPPTETWAFNVHHPFKETYPSNRRSIYVMTQRIQRHPVLGLFDGADPGATTDRRMETTTPSQALFAMNDPFMHEQSANFAQRLASLGGDAASQIAAAYELAYCRPPAPAETEAALAFIDKYRATLQRLNVAEADREAQTMAAYLRTILSSNEFFFVD
jgi:hypothetical protein